MDKFPGEVWSRVAASAFELRASQLEAMKMSKVNMQATIERLKKEAQAESADSRESGSIDGKDWAAKYAKPSVLRKLDKLTDDHNYDDISGDTQLMSQVEAIIGEWSETLGDDWESLSQNEIYIAGFLQGAVELWKEVKKDV